MHIAITLSVVLGLVLLTLFVVWRVRYRYPPADVPQVLCYHKLSDRFCFEGTWTTPRRFLDQIDHLLGKGMRFIDETEFLETINAPSAAHAGKILLTFDDGYESLFRIYVDHLAQRRIPVLAFLPTDYMGRENDWDLSLGRRPSRHMSWEQAGRMLELGARFGSHGKTHRDLTRLAAASLEGELVGSREAIERTLGTRVRSLSYPFGRYDAAVRDAVAASGYDAAFSLYPRHANETTDRLALRRNGVYVIDTARTIERKLEPDPLFWFEEMKCRTINGLAVLTPMLKRFSPGPGR